MRESGESTAARMESCADIMLKVLAMSELYCARRRSAEPVAAPRSDSRERCGAGTGRAAAERGGGGEGGRGGAGG
jgi:hypothetical protein